MEPGPTAEPRRLNTSLLMLLKVECTLGEPKSLGLNWNSGTCISVTECIVTTQAHDAHIYVKSKRAPRHVNYKGKKELSI